MKSRMTTTTALIASLSLMVPGPMIAQESAPAETNSTTCADGSDSPCADGVTEAPAPVTEEEAAPAEEPAAEAPAEVPAEAPAEEPAAEEPAAEAPAEVPAAEEPAAEAPAEVPAAEEPAAEAPAAEEPAAEAPAEVPAAEAPATEQPAAEAPVVDEPAAVAEEPAAEQPAAEQPATELPAAEESATEPSAEEPAAKVAPVEAPVTEEAPAAAEPAAETPEEAAAPETEATEEAPADAAEATVAAPVPNLPVQPDAATGKAPVAEAASAPIDENLDTAAPGADVTEEVVTKDTARSSDEDFTTTVSGKKKKKPAAVASKDKGLSGGEKAILLGLGALAVGSILSNNRKVELNSGDRVVVERDDGSYQIIKDDNALLRRPGSTVRTQTFDDGSSRTIVTREDGSRIVTIRDAEYRVLKRVHVGPDGTEYALIDDTEAYEPVIVSTLPPRAPDIRIAPDADEAALRAALAHEARIGRSFSLGQIRNIEQVRALVPVIDLDRITFETGSAAIKPDQARSLSHLGKLISDYIADNPREMFLIEGHTDAVGSAASNLALSDRRAESVALALTEYFDVPPENLVVQGYGEEFLKVPSEGPERENRRASVRRITDLLRHAANN